MDVCGGNQVVRDAEGADTFSLVTPSPVLFNPGASQKVTYIVRDARKTKKTIKASYKAKAAAVLGSLHVSLGLLAMADNIVGLFYQKVPVVDGIWISTFFLISGGLAIGGSSMANMCLVVATMVMSIISAVCAALLVIAYSIALTPTMLHWRCHDNNMTAEERCVGVTKVTDGLLVAIGLVMVGVATLSAVLTCRATCCRSRALHSSVHYTAGGGALSALNTEAWRGAAGQEEEHSQGRGGRNYQRF